MKWVIRCEEHWRMNTSNPSKTSPLHGFPFTPVPIYQPHFCHLEIGFGWGRIVIHSSRALLHRGCNSALPFLRLTYKQLYKCRAAKMLITLRSFHNPQALQCCKQRCQCGVITTVLFGAVLCPGTSMQTDSFKVKSEGNAFLSYPVLCI